MEKNDFKPTCMNCGSELQFICEKTDFNEEIYICPKCNVMHTYMPVYDDDKDEYHFYNPSVTNGIPDEFHGYNGLCPKCGTHIIWSCDAMRSEIIGDVEEGDSDTLVVYVSCPECGGITELVYPTEDEINTLKE
jgi:predicted RNA-binding Zn-ribbon protein involved in translation (DUF1610 family)